MVSRKYRRKSLKNDNCTQHAVVTKENISSPCFLKQNYLVARATRVNIDNEYIPTLNNTDIC